MKPALPDELQMGKSDTSDETQTLSANATSADADALHTAPVVSTDCWDDADRDIAEDENGGHAEGLADDDALTSCGMPLQKWLIAHDLGSKTQLRLLITEGRVRVDGEVVRRFAHPVDHTSRIEVDDTLLLAPAPRTVLLMNKPKRHLTRTDDDGETPGLGRYLPADLPRVFAVGRLDFNTEGALLWTNDGKLARRILDPAVGMSKEYHVKVRDLLKPDDPGFARIRNGLRYGGERYRPAPCEILEYRTRATWVRITLTEGRYHEVRRMCAVNRWQIVKLRRASIGPILLGDLNPRCVRALTDDELVALERAAGLRED